MLLRIIVVTGILLPHLLFGQDNTLPTIKKGSWTANLQLENNTFLPFQLQVIGKGSDYDLSIINGSETIILEKGKIINDSIHFYFPSFNSKLIIKNKGKKKLKGYWINFNKSNNYKIPFSAKFGYTTRFNVGKTKETFPYLDGKWETTFDPNTEDAYKGIGLFEQHGNKVEGTFRTETGDFRFLEGNVTSDSLFLSCFDGSHAFLIKSKIIGDSMYGSFYSGKHWKGLWNARCNESFELGNPDSLTYVINDTVFTFTLKDLEGKDFTFPNSTYKDKVTIIQIMGTWCPNCMDETVYLKELHEKYHNQGLEIISVGYEVGTSFKEHAERINRLKNKYNLPFQFLVGGTANKGLASEHFRMLNQIISFPTSIFIGKDGTVRKVHTGFNGPGTGEYYINFVKENESFLQSLIEEK
jgi:thiol-disulfide isomerase/thioredoxin